MDKNKVSNSNVRIVLAIILAIVGIAAGIILAWPSMKDPQRVDLLLVGIGLLGLSSIGEFGTILYMYQRIRAEQNYQNGLQHGVHSRIIKESVPMWANNGAAYNGNNGSFPQIPYPQMPAAVEGNGRRTRVIGQEYMA